MKKDTKMILALMLVIAMVGLTPWIIQYLMRDVSSPLQICQSKCQQYKKDGYLIYEGPPIPRTRADFFADKCVCK